MPCDEGFLLPCQIGELYANDNEISCVDSDGEHPAQIASKEWDLAPRLEIAAAGDHDSSKQSNGFGREVKKLLVKKKGNKKKKRG